MAASEKARRTLAVAQAAEEEITASVSEGEATVRTCRASVEKAAKAVCTEAYREIREEIAVLEDQVEALRRRSWDLAAVADYPPARWQLLSCRTIPKPWCRGTHRRRKKNRAAG
jgi:hypothetical protein